MASPSSKKRTHKNAQYFQLHRECGIVHTGIKAENVAVSIPNIENLIRAGLQDPRKTEGDPRTSSPFLASQIHTTRLEENEQRDYSSISVKLCDLGNGPSPATKDADVGIQTAAYRSPEVTSSRLRGTAGWTFGASAVWSVFGIFELLSGSHLFHTPADYNRDDHLNQIVDMLGTFPFDMITAGEYIPLHIFDMEIMKKMQNIEDWCLRKMMAFNGFESEIIGCLEAILIVDPAKRPEAGQILNDPDHWLGPEKTT
ncbi:hypothetical protein PTTG_09791 [Puccinia triticina 1-1 BBBD Race 1]|uniref:non-specific serine/threonine protein kinase n=1 Tax=Puccinia triticina (isolate 1-1 / race 1 (BBBD)) TaxID=630390 RepID=A0A180H1B2_PUCT1|nr:hypothetical protein PTTG_09791 [Puccinia triticina 1-1 BBBD Race 1]WAR58419.1 hypothetical protein PtB15_5B653 [Puccinia triticina]